MRTKMFYQFFFVIMLTFTFQIIQPDLTFNALAAVQRSSLAVPVSTKDAWTESDQLVAIGPDDVDHFGKSVSISRNYAIVGAYGDDDAGNGAGAAYIFHRDGNQWIYEQKLLASGAVNYDSLGSSVGISEDRAIIGGEGAYRDTVYIFHREDNQWFEVQQLLAADGETNNGFGSDVAISGDWAFIGAAGDTVNGTNSGAAYVFHWSGTQWVQHQKLMPDDGSAWAYFGSGISISGNQAVIGAMGASTGLAYIFRFNGTYWLQEQKLTASDGASLDHFGQSVDIDTDWVIVGARQDDDNGNQSGSVYMFYQDESQWVQRQKITPADGNEGAYFGTSVSLSGNRAVIGADRDDDLGAASGSAYIYYFNGSQWVQEQKLLSSDGDPADDYFGTSVAIDGDHIIIGADSWKYDPNTRSRYGTAYIFERISGSGEHGNVSIRDLRLYQQDFPNPEQWIEVGQTPAGVEYSPGKVVDGNIVRISMNLENIGDTAISGTVIATEMTSGNEVGRSQINALMSNETKDIQIDWDTYGYAWNDNQTPATTRQVQVQFVPDSGNPVVPQPVPVHVIPRPIILVHGWSSNAEAWNCYTGSCDVEGNEGNGDFLTNAYSADWHAFAVNTLDTGGDANRWLLQPVYLRTNTLEENAALVRNYVEERRNETNAWHVDLIGHSMGGLISRVFIHRYLGNPIIGKPTVINFLTLGTPHEGAECAKYFPFIYQPATSELLPEFWASFQKQGEDSILCHDAPRLICCACSSIRKGNGDISPISMIRSRR